MAKKTDSKSNKLAIDSLFYGLSYGKYKKESLKQNIKTIRKENYYFIRDELQGKKISITKLEKIEKYKGIRKAIYKQKEKEYVIYSVEIIGYCPVHLRIPDGTKVFVRNEIISSKCQDTYKEAKELFLNNFEIRRVIIWKSKNEILTLDSTVNKEWCM